MQKNDKVEYVEKPLSPAIGTIREVKGRKWVTVEWSDNVIQNEHIDDLSVVVK